MFFPHEYVEVSLEEQDQEDVCGICREKLSSPLEAGDAYYAHRSTALSQLINTIAKKATELHSPSPSTSLTTIAPRHFHIVHLKCISPWAVQHGNCPSCRTPVTVNDAFINTDSSHSSGGRAQRTALLCDLLFCMSAAATSASIGSSHLTTLNIHPLIPFSCTLILSMPFVSQRLTLPIDHEDIELGISAYCGLLASIGGALKIKNIDNLVSIFAVPLILSILATHKLTLCKTLAYRGIILFCAGALSEAGTRKLTDALPLIANARLIGCTTAIIWSFLQAKRRLQ